MNKKMSVYRIIMIVCGALLLLCFFFVPCYKNTALSLAGALGDWAGMGEAGGIGKSLASLSSFRIIRMVLLAASELEAYGLGGLREYINPVIAVILFGIPVLLIVLLEIFAVTGKKPGAVGGIVCSAGLLICYLIQTLSLPGSMKAAGYRISFFYFVVFVIAVLSLVMSILELKSARWEYQGTISPGGGSADTIYDPYEGGEEYGSPSRTEGVIVGIAGEYKGATLSAADGVRITIGRSTKECNLVLGNPTVSRTHCYITYDAEKDVYKVMDVSKFGVYDAYGKPIEKNTNVYMGTGDEIHIGKSGNAFRLE